MWVYLLVYVAAKKKVAHLERLLPSSSRRSTDSTGFWENTLKRRQKTK
jgi:hypothetical protein